nr:MAG TPA: hypothetical protein [Caudoviricetes sp.]
MSDKINTFHSQNYLSFFRTLSSKPLRHVKAFRL